MNPPQFSARRWALTLLAGMTHMGQAWATTPTPWHLVVVGDVMLGSDYPTADVPANQGRGLLTAALPVLQTADLTVGNLEGTLGVGGATTKSGCKRCFAFRSPPAVAQTLASAGFDAWSQANNHARDFGATGLQQTAMALEQAGMKHAGPMEQPMAQWTVRGKQACLLAFAPNAGMHDVRDVRGAQQWIAWARSTCDLVVVLFHGGGEGLGHQHTPVGSERYLGEDRGDVRAFAHAAIDAGADLVVGQGPHVVRGMELYRGHLVAYSLGNFMTYGGMNVGGPMGWAPALEITLDSQGQLVRGQIHSFQQHPRQPLAHDPEHQAARAIATLTAEDFHGGQLHFGDDGQFVPERGVSSTLAQSGAPD